MDTSVVEHIEGTAKPLIVILGPTASGKTGYSIDLALRLPRDVEIVNADSRQLYRKLDIGTAKIKREEMQGIPHHLIDVLDPKEEATAGWYQLQARESIDDVLARGNVPFLVGGSMLYISTITDGLTLAPKQDPALRKALIEDYERDGGRMLHERLSEIDPEAAERIPPQNMPRLIRAVEIYALTQRATSTSVPKHELRSDTSSCPYDLFIIGMDVDRDVLKRAIDDRTATMFQDGWIEEVQGLMEQGYGSDDPGMTSHGYREIMQYLAERGPGTVEELQERIAAKTRQYAKRQRTWWRGDSRIQWITP